MQVDEIAVYNFFNGKCKPDWVKRSSFLEPLNSSKQ